MTWQNIETVPLNQVVLVAWGTKSMWAMGYEVTSFDGEKWWDSYTDGYIPLAWMPLPPLPNK